MYVLRTRIKRDIVCEFLPPALAGARHRSRAIILAGGTPGYPGRREALMQFLAQKGYWTFVPRYRGTWESGGSFLRIPPHRDILDVVDELPRGFRDLWSGKGYRVSRPEVYLIGSSFGGAAVILASRDPRVRRAVAFSPVTDWRAEQIGTMQRFTREAFGNGYRGTVRDWRKLESGAFSNPAHEAKSIDGAKLLIFHAKDDTIVSAKTSATFARATGAQLVLLPRGGHLSLSNTMTLAFWKKIRVFLK